MGYDFDELYPGRFLKSAEFKGKDVTYTVKAIELERLEGEKGEKTRGVISFQETEKQLVLNRTNGECIRVMFGRNTDLWVGKRITFWPQPFTMPGEEPGTAIRVRGSPDLQRDTSFELKLRRKKPQRVTLKRTGQPAAAAAAPTVDFTKWTAAKLSGRLDALTAWLEKAATGHPERMKAQLEASVIENELSRRSAAPPSDGPPPADPLPPPLDPPESMDLGPGSAG